jgi:hypothetical protein
MNPNLLAIIVAFYLSKFDKQALKNLGFKSNSDAFKKTAEVLGVKKNYVKFRRDEFDPIHPWRKGWIRPMDSRIIKSIEALQDLDEPDLREIVQHILSDTNYRKSEEIRQITSLFSGDENEKIEIGTYILRAPTGRKAEEYFLKYYEAHEKPIAGNLIDCRDWGVGYDFRIEGKDRNFFIEVKGISEFAGGVLFTNKEWRTAEKERDSYFLCIVSNIGKEPEISFIQNPSEKIKAKRNIRTVLQVSWSVSASQLAEIND